MCIMQALVTTDAIAFGVTNGESRLWASRRQPSRIRSLCLSDHMMTAQRFPARVGAAEKPPGASTS